MEKMILGILLLKRLTAYEMRGIISQNFKSMCSDSLGGIQAALKRLLRAGKVTCAEVVERGVNKKRYAITDAGRADFRAWVTTPAEIANPKNIEISKLLFMGLVPRAERRALVDEAIRLLQQELSYLMAIYDSIQQMDIQRALDEAIDHYARDAEYRSGIIAVTENDDLAQVLDDYVLYEHAALQYGIDATKFQIDWLEKIKEKMGED